MTTSGLTFDREGVSLDITRADYDRIHALILTRWSGNPPMALPDLIYERYVNEIIAAKVQDLAQFARDHDYLRYGDGQGGGLLLQLEEALGIHDAYSGPVAPSKPARLSKVHRRLHRLAERDGSWDCHYCRKPLGCACADPLHPAVVEHQLPQSRGGPDTDANCVIACYPCNTSKGDQTPSEWGGPKTMWESVA